MKKVCLIWILVFVTVFVGCDSKEDSWIDSNSIEPNVAAKISVTNEMPQKNIIVSVNGVDITEDVLEEKIQAEIEKKKVPMPPAFLEKYKQELRRKILDDMIVELLLDKEVKENKIVVTLEDVDNRISQMNAENRMSMQDFLEMLDAMGEDLNEYKRDLQKRISHEKLLQVKLFNSIEIDEEDAKRYYSENSSRYQNSFEESKDDIVKILTRNKQKELFAQYVDKLKGQARIDYR